MRREMYHTQEKRGGRLYKPIICTRKDAWLGYGYYFWDDVTDADKWGVNSKNKTGYYQVYKGVIDGEGILDTVFSEKDYSFFIQAIEKVVCDCRNKSGRDAEISDVCRYLMEVAKWDTMMDGVLFADSPNTEIKSFNFRRRIQMVLYNLNCLESFNLLKEEHC